MKICGFPPFAKSVKDRAPNYSGTGCGKRHRARFSGKESSAEAKAIVYFQLFAARLKSCPVTKQPFERHFTGFSAACKARCLFCCICGPRSRGYPRPCGPGADDCCGAWKRIADPEFSDAGKAQTSSLMRVVRLFSAASALDPLADAPERPETEAVYSPSDSSTLPE